MTFLWGVPIVPALHGTDINIAHSIAENGFANLSSLDAGFFGKGDLNLSKKKRKRRREEKEEKKRKREEIEERKKGKRRENPLLYSSVLFFFFDSYHAFSLGIYFTSHALYTLPYIASRRKPALIISWILPGTEPNLKKRTQRNKWKGTKPKKWTRNQYVKKTKDKKKVQRKSEK